MNNGQVSAMPESITSGPRLRREVAMYNTYKIIRKYQDWNHHDKEKVIDTGLTLEEAKKHCNDPDTHKEGVWFDAYYEE